MQETLLFTTTLEMLTVLERVQAAFPTAELFMEPRDGPEQAFPGCLNFTLNLDICDERSWCTWAVENDILRCCYTLVLLSMDPPEWMQRILKVHALKEEVKRLTSR